jgi:hypothetical protein
LVRFRRIRLADHRGRDATVLLVPVGESIKRRHQDMDGRPVKSVRRVRATRETCADALLERYPDPDELTRSLINGDPEIDVETTGRASGPATGFTSTAMGGFCMPHLLWKCATARTG